MATRSLNSCRYMAKILLIWHKTLFNQLISLQIHTHLIHCFKFNYPNIPSLLGFWRPSYQIDVVTCSICILEFICDIFYLSGNCGSILVCNFILVYRIGIICYHYAFNYVKWMFKSNNICLVNFDSQELKAQVSFSDRLVSIVWL